MKTKPDKEWLSRELINLLSKKGEGGMLGTPASAVSETEQAIQAHIDKKIIELLDRLEALPNVYPEKIDERPTHVKAIYKSAISAERQKLRGEL